MVLEGETGLLVDPNEVSALSSAIIRVLTEPELAAKMGERARIRALGEYSWAERARHLAIQLGLGEEYN
jgi:glycosyltransferase involved in cell wall biosynthesis